MSDTRKKNVLIVDDDEDIVRMISVLLENEGHCCTIGHTGAQGAVEFSVGDTDLVITDLNMPAGDGIALIERIRRTSDVPIIVVTAFDKEYANRVRAYRGVTVLRKPFDSEALIELVDADLTLREAG